MFSNNVNKIFLLLLSLAMWFVNCSPNNDTEEIVAQVGNTALTRQDLQKYLNWESIRPDQESEFVRQWVDRELMYQEAKRLNLQDDKILKYEMKLVEKEFLVNKLLTKTFSEKIQVTDEQIAAYYEDNIENFTVTKDEIRANHILTDTRARADLARSSLMDSTPFAEVAAEYSVGLFKDDGGHMGFFTEKDVIPQIWNVASRAKINNISRVFSSPHGFHILQVLEIRKKNDQRPLDEVKNEIALRLKSSKERAAYFDLIVQLRNRKMVYINVPNKSDANAE